MVSSGKKVSLQLSQRGRSISCHIPGMGQITKDSNSLGKRAETRLMKFSLTKLEGQPFKQNP